MLQALHSVLLRMLKDEDPCTFKQGLDYLRFSLTQPHAGMFMPDVVPVLIKKVGPQALTRTPFCTWLSSRHKGSCIGIV